MNFALILFVLLVATGAIWLLDIVIFRRWRSAGAAADLAAFDKRYQTALVSNEAVIRERAELEAKLKREPWWIEYPKSFFPVILIVFLLRSFLVEPFKIPSGSMLPTLLIGDFILVNKYAYGIRIPIVNYKVLDIDQPRRGEVMVFRFPDQPSLDYIKRVVGLPGDKVSYRNKRLAINSAEVPTKPDGQYNYVETGLTFVSTQRFLESLNGHPHAIILRDETPTVQLSGVQQFPFRENCVYNETGFSCTVPPGHYFVMGDNRDSSSDSRYWGFVPDRNVVGRAFLVWWNFDDFKRIGHSIN